MVSRRARKAHPVEQQRQEDGESGSSAPATRAAIKLNENQAAQCIDAGNNGSWNWKGGCPTSLPSDRTSKAPASHCVDYVPTAAAKTRRPPAIGASLSPPFSPDSSMYIVCLYACAVPGPRPRLTQSLLIPRDFQLARARRGFEKLVCHAFLTRPPA